GHRAAGGDRIERRVMKRQRQASERDDAGIDEDLLVVGKVAFAFEKAERIAAPQADLTEFEDAATITEQVATPAQALVWPQGQAAADPTPIRVTERAFSSLTVRSEGQGELLPNLDPGEWQQPGIAEAALEDKVV